MVLVVKENYLRWGGKSFWKSWISFSRFLSSIKLYVVCQEFYIYVRLKRKERWLEENREEFVKFHKIYIIHDQKRISDDEWRFKIQNKIIIIWTIFTNTFFYSFTLKLPNQKRNIYFFTLSHSHILYQTDFLFSNPK